MDVEKGLLTTGEMTRVFGVTAGALDKWRKNGCPGRIARGTWDFRKTVQWLDERREGGAGGDVDNMRFRKLQADTEYREERARRESLLREMLEEMHFSREDVHAAWLERVEELRSSLGDFAPQLAKACHGKSLPEIEEIVSEHVRAFLIGRAQGA